MSRACQEFCIVSKAAHAAAEANRILADATLILANYHTQHTTTETQATPSQSPPSNPQPLLPAREAAFIQAWWDCLGTQTVTASDLYRSIAYSYFENSITLILRCEYGTFLIYQAVIWGYVRSSAM